MVLAIASCGLLAAWQVGFRYVAPDLFLACGGDSARWGLLVSVVNAGSLAASLVALRLGPHRSVLWAFALFVRLAPMLILVASGSGGVTGLVPGAVVAGLGAGA